MAIALGPYYHNSYDIIAFPDKKLGRYEFQYGNYFNQNNTDTLAIVNRSILNSNKPNFQEGLRLME